MGRELGNTRGPRDGGGHGTGGTGLGFNRESSETNTNLVSSLKVPVTALLSTPSPDPACMEEVGRVAAPVGEVGS